MKETVKTSPILMISGLSGVIATFGGMAALEPLLVTDPPVDGAATVAPGTGGKSANESVDPV